MTKRQLNHGKPTLAWVISHGSWNPRAPYLTCRQLDRFKSLLSFVVFATYITLRNKRP